VKFGLKEKELITGAVTGVTVFAGLKYGLVGKLPAVGPLSPPMLAIIIGLVIAAGFDGGGMGGDIFNGVGYGLIAGGVAAL